MDGRSALLPLDAFGARSVPNLIRSDVVSPTVTQPGPQADPPRSSVDVRLGSPVLEDGEVTRTQPPRCALPSPGWRARALPILRPSTQRGRRMEPADGRKLDTWLAIHRSTCGSRDRQSRTEMGSVSCRRILRPRPFLLERAGTSGARAGGGPDVGGEDEMVVRHSRRGRACTLRPHSYILVSMIHGRPM